MSEKNLSLFIIGQSLDNIANIDPRGYGVCNILYAAARERAKSPLCTKGAKLIIDSIAPKGLVYIVSGFVLPGCEKAETDGLIGAVLLSRALSREFCARPVIICPAEGIRAVKAMADKAGLTVTETVDGFSDNPSLAVIEFTKDESRAFAEAESLIEKELPSLVISIEAPGANEQGQYHSAKGINITHLEAKSDILFELLQKRGVPSLSIGDLGNEIGMSAIKDSIVRYIKGAGLKGCLCGCDSGIRARTAADVIITATASDWGVYALISALAFIRGNKELIPSGEELCSLLNTAVDNGITDMCGEAIPAIDGFSMKLNSAVINLMKECVSHALDNEGEYEYWFDGSVKSGYFNF